MFETSTGGLGDEVLPSQTLRDHLIDLSPIGNATDVTVVDPNISFDLTREVIVPFDFLLGVVLVDCIELHTALTTPVDGIFKELAFAYAPENQAMLVLDEHAQGFSGEGKFLTNLGIFVFYDCSVEIYCNSHRFILLIQNNLKWKMEN